MSNTTTATLTIRNLLRLSRIVEAAQGNQQVTFLDPETMATTQGTARSIGDEQGYFLREEDVRDGYLRVTMQSGLERFEPMSDLLDALDDTFFVFGK